MSTKADLILKNGFIYTVDKNRTTASAVALGGGRILYVGDDAGVEKLAGSATEVIDLGGRMVLPGFIDSHAHASVVISPEVVLPLFEMDSLEEYLAAVAAFVEAHPRAEVIYGAGWKNELFPPQGPRKEDLDSVVSDRPVCLTSTDGHSIWVNSKAIELSGLTGDSPCPRGGAMEKDPATGELWGTFRENARDPIRKVLPPHTTRQVKGAVREFMAEAGRVGITSVHDPMLLLPGAEGDLSGFGELRNNVPAYSQLSDQGEMTLRVRGTLLADPSQGASQVAAMAAAAGRYRHPHFGVTGAKLFIDGVVEGSTAYLLEPYAHMPGFRGEPLWDREALNELCAAVDRKRLQIHIHAIGDAAIRMSLDALEQARRENGPRDSRHAITHLQVVDPDDIPRFGRLGVVCVPQPFWHVKGEYFWELEAEYLGRERAEREYPLKSLAESGAVLAGASDYPVQVPSPPLVGIMLGVIRREPGETDPREILGPKERMTLEEMIAAYTINGAYANFLEEETGSLEVGKKADLVVLERNLFRIPAEEIGEVEVMMTIFEGKKVFTYDRF